MKTEAFGKALLPRPQSTVGTLVQMDMQPDREDCLRIGSKVEQEHKCKVDEVGCE